MDVKMCKNVYIFSWATVIVYIYTVTVAHLSIKIILSLYDIKTSFSLFFLSPLTEHTNASLKSQLLSPCFIPEFFLSSFLFVCFLLALLILITTGNNNVIGLGVLQPREEGGSIDRLIFSIDKLRC